MKGSTCLERAGGGCTDKKPSSSDVCQPSILPLSAAKHQIDHPAPPMHVFIYLPTAGDSRASSIHDPYVQGADLLNQTMLQENLQRLLNTRTAAV